MSDPKLGHRINLYLRSTGEDVVLREALLKLPRGATRKLMVEAVRALVPGAYGDGFGAERLAKELTRIVRGERRPTETPEEAPSFDHNQADNV